MATAAQSIYFSENLRCEYEYDDYIMLPIKEHAFEWGENAQDPYPRMRYVCINSENEESSDGYFDCVFITGRENDGEFLPEEVCDEFAIYRGQYNKAGMIKLRFNPREKEVLVSVRNEHGVDAHLAIEDRLQEMGAETVVFE